MNYQTIFDFLISNGFTPAGALGVLGNFECESNCESIRVQGDFTENRVLSKYYTQKVDNGEYWRTEFINDQKGYGLAQWTFNSRKAGLFDLASANNVSIGDINLQLCYLMKELQAPEYESLLYILRNNTDVYQCTAKFCGLYERPALNNINDRINAALKIKALLHDNAKPDVSNIPEYVYVEFYGRRVTYKYVPEQ